MTSSIKTILFTIVLLCQGCGGGGGGSGGGGGGDGDGDDDVRPDGGDTEAPQIMLLGDNPASILLGENYSDAGATVFDNVDADIELVRSGTVDTMVLGSYLISYSAVDRAGNVANEDRIVNVLDPFREDTDPPVITVIGSELIDIAIDSTYVDAGATATDNYDGSVDVQSSGSVDTSISGSYFIRYAATDSAGNTGFDTREVRVVGPVSLHVAPTLSGRPIAKILSAEREIVDVQGGATLELLANNKQLIAAINDAGQLEYLALSLPGKSDLDIDSQSTAFSLVVMIPTIMTRYLNDPESITNLINNDAKVMELVVAISQTPAWSEMEDEVFLQAYSAALVSVLSEIKVVEMGSPASQKSQSKVTVNGGDSSKSGIALTLISDTNPDSLQQEFSVRLQNTGKRWVGVLVDPIQHGMGSLDNFPLGSKSDSKLKPYSNPGLSQGDEDSIFVSVVGPGRKGDTGQFSEAESTAYVSASAQTLLRELAIPTLGIYLGNPTCLKDALSSGDVVSELVRSVVSSSEFRDDVKDFKFQKAGNKVPGILEDKIKNLTLACIKNSAFQLLSYLIPVLGQIDLLIFKSIELANLLESVASDWDGNNVYEYWKLENRMGSDLTVLGMGHLTDLPHGKPGYTSSLAITDEWKALFPGNCALDDEEPTVCVGFTYEGDGPYVIKATISCSHPVETDTRIPCGNARFSIDDQVVGNFDANESGVIAFEHTFSTAKEYAGFLVVRDIYGAEKQISSSIQIKKAQPQLVILQQGAEKALAYQVSEEQYVTNPPFEMNCCDEGKDSVTQTFELSNLGFGSAQIDAGFLQPNNSDYVVSGLDSLTVAAKEKQSFDVTYTPSCEEGVDAEFSVSGLLGQVPVDGIVEEKYSTMALALIDGNAPDIQVNVSSNTLGNFFPHDSAKTIDVQVSNAGDRSLCIGQITSSDSKFRWGNISQSTIAAGDSASFTVTFEPFITSADEAGNYSSTISIHSNDPDEAVVEFALSATISLPPPPIISASSPVCVTSDAATVWLEYRIRSKASGTKSINSSRPTGQINWLYSDSRSYGGDTVDCWQHTAVTGDTIEIIATDEFDQTTTLNLSTPSCEPRAVYPGVAWAECAEYYAL